MTITADAVMGDRYNAVIIYTISRDDGTALLPEGAEDAMLLVHGNGTDLSILGGTHGGSLLRGGGPPPPAPSRWWRPAARTFLSTTVPPRQCLRIFISGTRRPARQSHRGGKVEAEV